MEQLYFLNQLVYFSKKYQSQKTSLDVLNNIEIHTVFR